MLKMILVGISGAISAAGGAAFALGDMSAALGEVDATETTEEIESISTELAAVPVIAEGKVKSYLVLRVSSNVDRALVKNSDATLTPNLVDAVFRATFDFASGGVKEIKSKHVEQLANEIARIANLRFGVEAVKSVYLEQFNLVSASEIRDKLGKPE